MPKNNNAAFADVASAIASFLNTRPGMFVAGILVGAIVMFVHVSFDKGRLLQDLEKREALVTQNIDTVRDMQGLSQTELKSWVHELHEQNRITREMQERVHKQEISLARAPVYLILIVLLLIVLMGWIIFLIHRENNSIAMNTIRSAIGLTPPGILKTFLTAQNEVNAAMTVELTSEENKELGNKRRNRKRLR